MAALHNTSIACLLFLALFFNLPDPPSMNDLRNKELIAKSGIPGSTFVHANGFVGENKTKQGALRMAVNALEGSSGAVFPPPPVHQ